MGDRIDNGAVAAAAEAWLAAFDEALLAGDPARVASLFSGAPGDDCHWRDLFALGWDLNSISGRDAIALMLADALPSAHPRGARLAPGRTPPREVVRAGESVIELMFVLETDAGSVTGAARLRREAGGPGGVRAWIVMTGLASIRGHEERTNACERSIHGDDYYAREFGGENWLDKHRRAQAFSDRDPAVLVIGAGQAGLSAAARLSALGIDTLVIDREARVGDNWRSRYHSLTLHNEVHVNHLPYMPFPQNWPVFIPKDKLANWFESYVDALDLLVWTGTELTGGAYDEAAGHWTVTLRRADGTVRTMHPRHLVFGTGVSAIPVAADLPGLEAFAGEVMHSGHYTQGAAWRGRRAIVIGTGNSGHDVAQDLHASGARVTMVQRSATHVVGIREAQRVYSLYAEGLPTDDCDVLATAMPCPVLVRAYRHATAMARQADAALRQGLAARGFRLTDGEDDTGFQMMYLRRGGGYYFNVGCSDLIASGDIALVQHDTIERAEAGGLRLRDGSLLEADLIVTATGFHGQDEVVRRSLGHAVADRAGPVWGLDAQGELRNMWRPTGQPGLWFIAGSLAQCRIWSKFLALQIQARELGIATDGGEGEVARQMAQAVALHQQGRPAQARAMYEAVLKRRPDDFQALHLSGIAAVQGKDLALALARFDAAIRVDPGHAEAHSNRGNVLQEFKRLADALASYDRAIELAPTYPEAHFNRGIALEGLGRLDEAIASFERAIGARPDYAEALLRLGNALQEALRVDEAIACYRKALAIRPDYAEARWNLSLASLLAGDYAEGWRAYESRWESEVGRTKRRKFPQPLWLGQPPLAGKTILLHAEQGFGDSIQFCRYAALVARLGARVLLEVPRPLLSLLDGLEGVDQLLENGRPLPDFDVHCPLLSLPHALGTGLGSVPVSPRYLKPDEGRLAHWAGRLGPRRGLRVGLVWSGNVEHRRDADRSIALKDMVARLPGGCDYVSLQKDVRATDMAALQASGIRHFGGELSSFSDTASLCDLMDLVVSVDTSVAHLAGALGKAAWILLARYPDWRWLLDRDDSPWYPSARLYRQSGRRQWGSVLERLGADLGRLSNGG